MPYERTHNSDSLKQLNKYVDELATGANPSPAHVSFWVRGDVQLELLEAHLDGTLANLYLAFGLINEGEHAQMRAQTGVSADSTNLLQWLDETVQDAVATADEHEARKKLVRELKATIEFRYKLGAVRVGSTYTSTTMDLARQLECLRVLELFLTEEADASEFQGLSFQLYHPRSAPTQTYQWDGGNRMASATMHAFVSADGCMHAIADRETLRYQLESLDIRHARVLAAVNDYWGRRQRDLVPQLRRVLGVQNIWCDNRDPESQEAFVLWAGRMLNAQAAFKRVLGGRRFSFSVLVHSDPGSPLIDYMELSSVLQVSSVVCRPAVELCIDNSCRQCRAYVPSVHKRFDCGFVCDGMCRFMFESRGGTGALVSQHEHVRCTAGAR